MKEVFVTGSLTTVTPLTYKVPDRENLPRIGDAVYLPSSAIRGKLRRMARDVIIDETGKKLDFLDFYYLTLGGLNNSGKRGEQNAAEDDDGVVTDKEAKESYAIPVIQAAERYNPLISLFGAGPGSPLAIPSKLFVNHAIAQASATSAVSKVSPVRTDDARISPMETQEVVSDTFFEEYLRQVAGQRAGSELKKRKTELLRLLKKGGVDAEAVRTELTEIDRALQTKPVSISNPGLDYEVINPGTKLTTSLRVIRANDTELALLMKAFARLAYHPVFGGKKAVGNGLVSGSFSVSMREHGKLVAPTEVGNFAWEGDFCGFTKIEGAPKEWLEMALPYGELRFDYKTIAAAAAA